MGTLLYLPVKLLLDLLQTLPLRWVARLGRGGGALAYLLDARHRRVAIANLRLCFGKELSGAQLKALARENFRRLGENYACGVRTAAMSASEVREVVEVAGLDRVLANERARLRSCIFALGHFGNFELYARCSQFLPGAQFATTYRALRQPALNRLLQSIREQSGCRFFERRTESQALQRALRDQRLMVGLLSDQHAGDRGLPLPFLGRLCSTSAAPAVFALRYQLPLFTAVCYRLALGRWRIEIGEEIPTHAGGQARSVEAITSDINQAFEMAVRRDPANWFWVHRRWKPGKYRGGQATRNGATAPVTAVETPGD